MRPQAMMPTLIEADSITKTYASKGGIFGLTRRRKHLHALYKVSLAIRKGEVLGLVGESGSGKSTFGQCLMGLTIPDSGVVRCDGMDIATFSPDQVKDIRRRFQIIYQDPFASLSPRMSIRDIICEPLDIHGVGTRQDRTDRAAELIEIVGLRTEHLFRFPHEFSGGQRQRISIARALALNPEFILADEAVSALDVSLQAQIINLLVDMQRKFSLTMLFITHDLSVVEYLCDRIAVLYMGRVVEVGRTKDLCSNPAHPYSQVLLSAIPSVDPRKRGRRVFMRGERFSPYELPETGCVFVKRCPQGRPECSSTTPTERVLPGSADHKVTCHFA